nr:ATP-binding domain-containing protein [Undibacterium seohonense]
MDGDPIWNEGEILVDSIYRFKGRSAAAVIISELDFSELTLMEKRKLFVGITRAQMSLSFVLTKQAEAVLAAQIA